MLTKGRNSPSTAGSLVQAANKGDKAAFGRLWAEHQDALRRMAVRMVQDEASAQDLLQESCLRAYLGLGQLRNPELFKAWCIGILINVHREWARNRDNWPDSLHRLAELTGGYQLLEDCAQRGSSEDPAMKLEDKELRQLVMESVLKLPTGLRKSALLFYFDGMTLEEASVALGVTPQALKMRLSRARAILRKRLRPT